MNVVQHRYLVMVPVMIAVLFSRAYPQDTDTLSLSPPPSAADAEPDTTAAESLEVYLPGPELSPSTEVLYFQDLLPGESRTLFMDLANLGAGEVAVDSVIITGGLVKVTLPIWTLRPGQFVRFPVTYTQTDLDTHHLLLVIRWESPAFETVDSLVIDLYTTPRLPLEVAPSKVVWERGYAGSKSTARVRLRNIGTRPLSFPTPPMVPQGVQLSPLPQVMAGESSTALTVSWVPAAAGTFHSPLRIPYRVDGATGGVELALEGEALFPAYFSEDTLSFGPVYAGSSYRRQVVVNNGSGSVITLTREGADDSGGRTPGADEGRMPPDWIDAPSQLEVLPGDTAVFDLRLSPRRAGTFLAAVRFRQQLGLEYGPGLARLPDLVLIVHAEVDLPLEVAADSVDFGPRPVLEAAMQPLRIENRGAVPVRLSLALEGGVKAFSVPPMVFGLNPGEHLEIPIYFRPVDMLRYQDTAVLRYETFGVQPELRVVLAGRGLDRPLRKLSPIPDLTLEEDFPGWHTVADLSRIFRDENHRVSFTLSHPFGAGVQLALEPDGYLKVDSEPHFHGAGEVVVKAVNEPGHAVADTFRLTIIPVNDLPRLVKPLPDLVLQEDPEALVVGRLSELFVDPDRSLDTVVTRYTIFSPGDDGNVRLTKRGDELVLTVAPHWHGSRSFVISARDADDTSVVVFDAFKVSILAVNDPPTLSPLPALELQEDDTVHVDWRPYVDDADHDVRELRFRFAAERGGSLPLAFTGGAGLTTIMRPSPNWFGAVDVRLTVTDPAGGIVQGTFHVTVHPENDPPDPFHALAPVSMDWDQRQRFSGRDTLLTFKWEPSANLDPGDDLFYTWQLLDTSGVRILKELPAGTETSLITQLDTAGVFLWTVLAQDSRGAVTSSDTLPLILEALGHEVPLEEGVLAFSFGPNYPNPFSGITRIEYTIPRYSDVLITIYDAMGRKVRVLRSESHYRGRYLAEWDGRDSSGQQVASGPYVAEIRAGGNTAYLKLVVVR